MRTHRVGAMPQQPKGDPRQHDQSHHQGRGMTMTGGRENNRARVHSGMSLEDLKRETAYRLAQSDGVDDGSPGSPDDLAGAGVGMGVVVVREPPTRHHHHHHHHHLHVVPAAAAHYQQQQQQQQQHGRAHRQQQQGQHHHSYIIRGGEPSPPSPAAAIVPGRQQQQWREQQQQQFSTPRMTPLRGGGGHHHHHATTTTTTTIATALMDRGSSAENSVGSADPPHFSSGGGGGGNSSSPREGGHDRQRAMGVGGGVRRTPPSPSSSKGNHHRGTTTSSRHRAGGGGGIGGGQQDPNGARGIGGGGGIGGGQRASSVGGRRTPVLGNRAMEGQVLFASPKSGNIGRPGCRPRSVTSPNHIGPRSPDQPHHPGGYSKASGVGAGVGGAYHGNNKDHHRQQQQHQSKLPHGLTVQELKEMTRARLAAEAEVGHPDGSSDQSVHSSGTRGSSMGSDQFARTNNNEFNNYPNQGIGSRPYQGRQPMQQMQARNSPHYNHPRHPSPVLGPGPFHFKGKPPSPAFGGDTWETASATSSTIASEYQPHADSMYRHNTTMSFASPMGDSNAMISNRGRAFSAGATNVAPYSFERHQAAYYDSVSSSTAAANRQRCATVSPPVMSRPHEDYRYLFSNNDRERLAIPPLSEPRLRSRAAGGVDASRAFSPPCASPPTSAFVPIGRTNDRSLPNSPPRNFVRSKFGYGDRAFSTGSAASGHGDLPSSMAEAVLGSITSVSAPGAPIGGQVILASPFRTTDRETTDLPFRESGGSGLMQESSGGTSLFSSGRESKNIFTCNSGDRMSLGTHSWGGSEDGPPHDGLSDDFSYLLNLSGFNGPPLRGRAATEPVWFGGSDTLLVSRIDPEHHVDTIDETGAFVDFNSLSSQRYGESGER